MWLREHAGLATVSSVVAIVFTTLRIRMHVLQINYPMLVVE